MDYSFHNLDNLAASDAAEKMTKQTLQNIQAMQSMPTAKGFVPDHTVLPVFQRQAEAEKKKNNPSNSHVDGTNQQ